MWLSAISTWVHCCFCHHLPGTPTQGCPALYSTKGCSSHSKALQHTRPRWQHLTHLLRGTLTLRRRSPRHLAGRPWPCGLNASEHNRSPQSSGQNKEMAFALRPIFFLGPVRVRGPCQQSPSSPEGWPPSPPVQNNNLRTRQRTHSSCPCLAPCICFLDYRDFLPLAANGTPNKPLSTHW